MTSFFEELGKLGYLNECNSYTKIKDSRNFLQLFKEKKEKRWKTRKKKICFSCHSYFYCRRQLKVIVELQQLFPLIWHKYFLVIVSQVAKIALQHMYIHCYLALDGCKGWKVPAKVMESHFQSENHLEVFSVSLSESVPLTWYKCYFCFLRIFSRNVRFTMMEQKEYTFYKV